MENLLVMSSSPHLRHKDSTARIMTDMCIALLPACIAGIYFFGTNAALMLTVCIMTCVASEYLWKRLNRLPQTVSDMSAVVTGILLALNLSPLLPLWIAAIGGVFAILVVKQLFGGIGQNFMNPALAARVVLTVSWPVEMTTWLNPNPDAVSSATPLALEGTSQAASNMDLFLGNVGGCIGETSVIALLIGAIYLIARRIITLEIPLTFIGTIALLTWVLGSDTLFTGNAIYHIMAGGLFLGAFFMATDYSSMPVTRKGKIIVGIGCGLVTAVIRLYAGYPEGVSFSILLINVASPLIDRYTIPRSFGGVKIATKHS